MNDRPTGQPGFWSDVTHAARGICMGAADVVPGVSGGTVALVVGIYERLVVAISRFDLRLLGLLRQRRWRVAARQVDLRFLLALALGIGIGFLAMMLLINRLLTDPTTRSVTFAAFFGMIVASCGLILMMIDAPAPRHRALAGLLGGLGALTAWWLASLSVQLHPGGAPPGLPYLFVCGSIAICAMILPGISGAMILLLLGVYVYLIDVPRQMLRGEELAGGALAIGVFAAGCVISLITFSKLLRWLLERYKSATMAVLCGFMVGALPQIWPFQRDMTPEVDQLRYKRFEPFWPETFDFHVAAALASAVLAAAVVLGVDYLTRLHRRPLLKNPRPDGTGAAGTEEGEDAAARV